VTSVIAAPVSGGRADTAAVSVTGAPSGQPEIAYTVLPAGAEVPDPRIWGLCPGSDTGMVLIGASGGGGTFPSWSPDGARLAFSTEDFWSCGDIYTARVDGSDQRRVTPDYHIGRTGTCSFYLAAPAWSPDGTQIAFSVVDERTLSGGCGISVINADGSNLRGLSAGGCDWENRPTWSPDGKRLAFWAGGGSLSVMNADGTGIVRLNPDIGCCYAWRPAWSPGGSQIAFEVWDYFAQVGGIWLMNADGSGAKDLTAGSGPAWSPDGSRLLFSRVDGLYVINRDGTGIQQLASIPGATSPAWRRAIPPATSAAVRTARTGPH